MEKNIRFRKVERDHHMGDILSEISAAFGRGETDLRTYSPLTFAYIGDAVFEIIIRTVIVKQGQRPANVLHKHKAKIVCAETQAKMLDAIYEELSGEEQDIYRRGRNAKIHSMAKNASLSDYRKATGFEALCGYLYLSDNMERVIAIVKRALDIAEIEL